MTSTTQGVDEEDARTTTTMMILVGPRVSEKPEIAAVIERGTIALIDGKEIATATIDRLPTTVVIAVGITEDQMTMIPTEGATATTTTGTTGGTTTVTVTMIEGVVGTKAVVDRRIAKAMIYFALVIATTATTIWIIANGVHIPTTAIIEIIATNETVCRLRLLVRP